VFHIRGLGGGGGGNLNAFFFKLLTLEGAFCSTENLNFLFTELINKIYVYLTLILLTWRIW